MRQFEVGERGIIYQTEVLRFIQPGESKLYQANIQTELRLSYFELMQQRLHLEAWDKEGLWLNKFLGYYSIPLLDIANGEFRQHANLSTFDNKGVEKLSCQLSFTMHFEEIWDFYLQFFDWKTTSLANGKNPN